MKTLFIGIKKTPSKNFSENFATACFFILNPLIALIMSLFFVSIKKKKQLNKILITVISGFIGLINVTKVLNSDLLTYHQRFLSAQYYSLSDYLSFFNREYLYYFISYIFYHFTGGAWNFFLFLITFFSYYFLLKSIFLVVDKANAKNRDKILIVLSIAFFYPLFSYSAHLVRNFIAGAIVLNFCLKYFIEKKNKWWLLICAIFIHTSSIFFLCIYFIPQKVDLNKIIKSSLGLIFLFTVFGLVVDFDKLTSNLYLFRRLNNIYINPRSGNLDKVPYIIFFFLYFIFIVKKTFSSFRFNEIRQGLIKFNYLFLIVILCAIGTSFFSPLMSERLLLFIYFLSTIFISTSLMLEGVLFKILRVLIPAMSIFLFCYKYSFGVWEYTEMINLTTNSLFDYFE